MKSSKQCFLPLISILLLLLTTNCSYNLKVTSLDKYQEKMPLLTEPVSIGLRSNAIGPQEEFFKYVIEESKDIANLKIIYPYAYSTENPVDYIVEIDPRLDYNGSFWNLPLNFPGFLIFAPAWFGYRYSVTVMTDVSVMDFKTNSVVAKETIKTKYKCKEAEFDRTWTNGTDWILTLGVCSLFGSFYVISYDDDITPYFNKQISPVYGDYIARKIVNSIVAKKNLAAK